MSVRVLLRIARRDVLRARGRSLLVLAMVALPVFGLAGFLVLLRTQQLDTDERLARRLGRADAALQATYRPNPIVQEPESLHGFSTSDRAVEHAGGDVRPLLPEGSRVLSDTQASVRVETDGGRTRIDFREVAYADPLLAGLVRPQEGRAPRTAGEVAVTPALLAAVGARIGDRLTVVDPDQSFLVVGTVTRPERLDERAAIGLPGALRRTDAVTRQLAERELLYVDTPAPVTWPDVLRLNERGVAVLSRAVVEDPPARADVPAYRLGLVGDGPSELQLVVLIVLVGGLAVLQVVLLAAAAFAVGARRQSRELGLLAAAGADPRQVRGVVLLHGVLLGTAGGLVGLVLGVAGAAVAVPVLERSVAESFGRFDVRLLELLPVVLLGAATGLAAALWPARAVARQDVLGALRGRRPASAPTGRLARRGLAVALVGIGVACLGAVGAVRGGSVGMPAAYTILAGAILVQFGLIVACPAVVAGAARLGGRLPPAPRLAVRDAGRHRGRSAPAVAAVLAAVAGSTAVSVFVSSQADKNRRAYTPLVARGQAWVDLMGYDGVRDAAPTVVAAVTAGAPVRDATVVRAVGRGHPDEPSTVFTTVAVPAANACPSSVLEAGDADRGDWRCQDWRYGTPAGIPVGDARTVEVLVGTSTPEAERVLAAGGMVVFDRRFLHDGRASVELHRNDDHEPTTVAFPAALVEAQRPAVAAVLSPAAARRLDLPVSDSAVVFAFDRLPTEDEEEAVSAALEREGIPSEFAVERGFESSYGAGLLALVLAAAAVTLGAAGIATGLAQADARADYATLAAVGAAPSTRRRLAAAQAGVVATLGAALGVAAGLVPGVAFVWALPSFHVVLPWTSLGVTVVVVPLLAALAAALLTRSRLPLRARGAE